MLHIMSSVSIRSRFIFLEIITVWFSVNTPCTWAMMIGLQVTVAVSRWHVAVAHNVRSGTFRQRPFQSKASSMIDLLQSSLPPLCEHKLTAANVPSASPWPLYLAVIGACTVHGRARARGQLPLGNCEVDTVIGPLLLVSTTQSGV